MSERIWSAAAQRYYTVKTAPPTERMSREDFERKYASLRPRILRWARARVRCTADAEDLTQTVLLKIMIVVDAGRVDSNPEAHAVQTLKNEIAAFWKTKFLPGPVGERTRRFVQMTPRMRNESHGYVGEKTGIRLSAKKGVDQWPTNR